MLTELFSMHTGFTLSYIGAYKEFIFMICLFVSAISENLRPWKISIYMIYHGNLTGLPNHMAISTQVPVL